jgi:two-component system sensor histidine kinase KdpD
MPLGQKGPRTLVPISLAVGAVVVVTLVLYLFRERANPATVALCYVLTIVVCAIAFESWAALAASLAASFGLNFFFLPPYYTLTIADPQNWITLFVFLTVAVAVGQLSARERRRAAEAERLYGELDAAFETASGAEAVRRSEKLKTALLDAVTHDMRTPLTSIKASVTMLIDENIRGPETAALDSRGRGELLEVINEETDRLNTFVESMVELAQIQSGQRKFARAAVLPEEIIVAAARRAKAIRSTHKLVSNVEPDLPKLNVDPRAMAEAVYDLLQNAAKYSPPGTTVLVSAARSGECVRFAVEDEGKGIPDAEREAVFERFYRSDDKSAGLGMGLAIVRGIVEGHGGKIWVESGKSGTRFVFDLPASDVG